MSVSIRQLPSLGHPLLFPCTVPCLARFVYACNSPLRLSKSVFLPDKQMFLATSLMYLICLHYQLPSLSVDAPRQLFVRPPIRTLISPSVPPSFHPSILSSWWLCQRLPASRVYVWACVRPHRLSAASSSKIQQRKRCCCCCCCCRWRRWRQRTHGRSNFYACDAEAVTNKQKPLQTQSQLGNYAQTNADGQRHRQTQTGRYRGNQAHTEQHAYTWINIGDFIPPIYLVFSLMQYHPVTMLMHVLYRILILAWYHNRIVNGQINSMLTPHNKDF